MICKDCGSPVTMRYHCDQDDIGLAVAGIETEGVVMENGKALQATEHIFISQKPEWYEIPDDGTKKWDRFTPDFEEKLHRWRQNRS